MSETKAVSFVTNDRRRITLFGATEFARGGLDTVPESISGRLPIEMRFYAGTEKTAAAKSYVVRVARPATLDFPESKEWGWQAFEPDATLAALDKFSPLELLPDAISDADKEEFLEYFVRIRESFKRDALDSLE